MCVGGRVSRSGEFGVKEAVLTLPYLGLKGNQEEAQPLFGPSDLVIHVSQGHCMTILHDTDQIARSRLLLVIFDYTDGTVCPQPPSPMACFSFEQGCAKEDIFNNTRTPLEELVRSVLPSQCMHIPATLLLSCFPFQLRPLVQAQNTFYNQMVVDHFFVF